MGADVPDTEEVRYSAYGVAALVSLIVLVVVALPLAALAYLLPQPWSSAGIAVVSAFAALVVVRSLRISMTIGQERVVVRNLVRSHEPPWSAIEAVELTSRSMIGDAGDEEIELVLRDGRRVLVQASVASARCRWEMLRDLRRFAPAREVAIPPE